MKHSGETEIKCYVSYPGLYTIEYNQLVEFNDKETFCRLLGDVSKFGFPAISSNPHELGLYKMSIIPYENGKDTYIIKLAVTQCIPNEVDAQLLAMHIVDFFDKCSLPLEIFNPEKDE